jgi:hypothetical protein
MREIWSVTCEPAFQATPLKMRDPISDDLSSIIVVSGG